jgi:hypothetical protein
MIRVRYVMVFMFFPAFFLCEVCLCDPVTWARSTDVKVSSDELSSTELDKRLNPEPDRPVLFNTGSAAVQVNEDGDPNICTRF